MLTSSRVYAAEPIILLGGAFFLIISGANLFGLLSSRPARRLCDVSYGIYLLQRLVMTLVFASESIRMFALGSPTQRWATTVACSIILLFVSAATHVGIERVGIDFGKRVYVALESVTKQAPTPLAQPQTTWLDSLDERHSHETSTSHPCRTPNRSVQS
jgi:peptidoglycan/LPS O-acetylase OafA/YrhL